MRHRVKRNQLARPADQRRAILRSMATAFIKSGEIVTTLGKAKALQPVIEKLITHGKKGDLHSVRQALKVVYNHETGNEITTDKGKTIPETVVRRLFAVIAPKYKNRQGGYTRLLQLPPRRGDAAPMAILMLAPEEFTAKPKVEKPKKVAKPKKAEPATTVVAEEAPAIETEAPVVEVSAAEEAPATEEKAAE